jgi:DNA invertase Pin-like site-specific DNA recombinase
MKLAAAYIRRSSVSGDNPGDASREAQLAAVHRLCGEDVTVYTDWGISGRKANRPEYVKLKADITAGKIGSVCAYSLSRLGRNARELLSFIELAQAHDVPVRTSVESIDTSTAMGRAMLTVMAAFAQLEVEQGMERSAAAREARKIRHDEAGLVMPPSIAPYGYKHVTTDGITRVERDESEPIEPLIAAYREAGSVLGACRLLEAQGVPAPRGGKRWATSALTRIIEREAPELLPAKSPAGRRYPASSMFAQLLRCPFCGRMLTPNAARRQYYCASGARERATHPRYAVREADVLDFLMAQSERLNVPAEQAALEGIEARQDAITARLDRAHELFIAGDIDRDRYATEKARAQADMDALAGTSSLADIAPDVQWTKPPETINAVLRGMWDYVELDSDLRPVRVQWNASIPEDWYTA